MGAVKLEDLPSYTYEDYIHWEDNWELINGIAYAMSPAPKIRHQNISAKIASQLLEALKQCNKCQVLMPIDWKIDEDTIVQPDNSVICHTPNNNNYITEAPKIIFEILSKSTAKKDRVVKYSLYEQEGVNYYILIDPEKNSAEVFHLQNEKYIKLNNKSIDSINFEIDECKTSVKFNISKIW